MAMASFKYDILVRKTANNKLVWFLASNPSRNLGSNVFILLNKLGAKGWEAEISGGFTFRNYIEAANAIMVISINFRIYQSSFALP